MAKLKLSEMPTEVLILVMKQIDQPKGLLAFIRTARRNHGIFCENEIPILAAVIRNAYQPAVLHDALAACEATQIARLWWVDAEEKNDFARPLDYFRSLPLDQQSFICQAQVEFILKYREVHSETLYDRDLLMSLYKLWAITQFFMDDFRLTASNVACNSLKRIWGDWYQNPSSTEESRLRRAFLRYEIYRKLFPNPPNAWTEQVRRIHVTSRVMFLETFFHFEREEILSVQEYLVGVVKVIFESLQVYVVETVRFLSQLASAAAFGRRRPLKRDNLSYVEEYIVGNDLDVFNETVSESTRRSDAIAARGLPLLYWLIALPLNDRIHWIVRVSETNQDPALQELLIRHHHLLLRTDGEDSDSMRSESSFDETHNLGWEWVLLEDLVELEESLMKRFVLRQAGYVFRDDDRLQREWQFPDPRALELGIGRRDSDESMGSDATEIDRARSIETMFRGIFVPDSLLTDPDGELVWSLRPSEKWARRNSGLEMPVAFSDQEAALLGFEY